MKIQIGETISRELSEALTHALKPNDIRDLTKRKPSPNTLIAVVYRQRSVSKSTHPLVIECVRLAIKKTNAVGKTLMSYKK